MRRLPSVGRLLLVATALLLPIRSTAAEVATDSQIWLGRSEATRMAFISGFQSGMLDLGGKMLVRYDEGRCLAKKPACDVNDLFDLVGSSIETEALARGVTSLYGDPANTYVLIGDAIRICFLRLKGVDTEAQLLAARSHGLAVWDTVKGRK